MRRILAAAVVGGIALAMMLTGTPASATSAEPNPPGCPKGNFCVYSGDSWGGGLTLRTRGNWSGRVGGRSVFNNGKPFPGADHVQLDYEADGRSESVCIHYNPGPGDYKLRLSRGRESGVVIKRVVWRGEC